MTMVANIKIGTQNNKKYKIQQPKAQGVSPCIKLSWWLLLLYIITVLNQNLGKLFHIEKYCFSRPVGFSLFGSTLLWTDWRLPPGSRTRIHVSLSYHASRINNSVSPLVTVDFYYGKIKKEVSSWHILCRSWILQNFASLFHSHLWCFTFYQYQLPHYLNPFDRAVLLYYF